MKNDLEADVYAILHEGTLRLLQTGRLEFIEELLEYAPTELLKRRDELVKQAKQINLVLQKLKNL